jgi:hypothetical protein
MPDAAGRGDHMALLGVRVRSLATTERVLNENRVAIEIRDDRLLVKPEAAMNVALEFVA